MNWYLKVLKQYADFEGRARRKEYWMFTLINIVIIIVLTLLTFVISDSFGSSDNIGLIPMVLIMLYVLGTLVPSIAVTVRRLHDTGKSGWWYLINFVPYIGGFVILVFTCMDSDNGVNKWGENPKGIGNHNAIDDIGIE